MVYLSLCTVYMITVVCEDGRIAWGRGRGGVYRGAPTSKQQAAYHGQNDMTIGVF